ncbi:MAG: flagellar motor switch protein FliN [Rhodospirillales bacterium]|nr:flagellar motor switch protein FliN [Rhodospirillales bacterium]
MADSGSGADSVRLKFTELEALLDVEVEITAVLGTSMMPVSQILKLGRGAVVELNRAVGEDIEVHANNRMVAHGEVVVVEDRLGVNLTDIVILAEIQKE